MTMPKNRSTSVRKKKMKNGKIHYSRRKESKVSCAICKKTTRKSSKKKRFKSNSTFGNNLCFSCKTIVLRYSDRIAKKQIAFDDVPMSYQRYVILLLKK